MPAKFQKIRDLIEQNKLNDAAEACSSIDKNFGSGIKRELQSIQQEFIQGLADLSDKRKIHNMLTLRILQFLDSKISPNGSDNSKTQDNSSKPIELIKDIPDVFIRNIENYLMKNNDVPTNSKRGQVRILSYYLLEEKAAMTARFLVTLENFNHRNTGAKEKLLDQLIPLIDHLEDFKEIIQTAKLKKHPITKSISSCHKQGLKLKKALVKALSSSLNPDVEIAQSKIVFSRLSRLLKEKEVLAETYKFSDS